MVDFANKQQREYGLNAYDAAIASAKSRLRPILMTSFTMIIGSLPLAFAVGLPGSIGRINIGLVLVGGIDIRDCIFVVCCANCLCGDGKSKALEY